MLFLEFLGGSRASHNEHVYDLGMATATSTEPDDTARVSSVFGDGQVLANLAAVRGNVRLGARIAGARAARA